MDAVEDKYLILKTVELHFMCSMFTCPTRESWNTK